MVQEVVIAALCLLVSVVALGIAAWAVISGGIGDLGIDELFLVVVCLIIAVAFLMIPVDAVRRGSLPHLLKKAKERPAEAQKQRTETVATAKSEGRS